MKKLLLIFILVIVSNSAMAEWVELGTSQDETGTIYANPATIRKSGNKVKMWDLTDYKTAQEVTGKQYMSSKSQIEYDCKEEQTRLLFANTYIIPTEKILIKYYK